MTDQETLIRAEAQAEVNKLFNAITGSRNPKACLFDVVEVLMARLVADRIAACRKQCALEDRIAKLEASQPAKLKIARAG